MPLHQACSVFGRSVFSLIFLASINAGISQAQITRDGTLPTRIQQLENMRKITGGERVGNNLFHSFEKFSIPEGIEAIFENAPDIQNIFTRVTGGEASLVNGLLQTAGGANFFLVNPNGIVFGENAVIDIGGSFIATTANRIEFADGKTFNVRDEKPLLTWNAPIGLGLDGNNGSITVNGQGSQIILNSSIVPVEFSEKPSGFFRPNNQTLALVGNELNFNNGVITTKGGNIYLTSIESGSVKINQADNELSLIDNELSQYQNININQRSLIDASGSNVGKIFVVGKNINLLDGSYILAQSKDNSSSGSININASESITLADQSPDFRVASSIISEIVGSNKGADVNITAKKMLFSGGGRIRVYSFSDGLAGDINITASDSIQLSRPSSIISTTLDKGNAGDINISTSKLQLDGTAINSSTFGDGDGGMVNINARLIEIIGGSATSRASIAATSFGIGNAGNLTINTEKLQVIDGASLSSSSFGIGNAGNLNITASESVRVSGKNAHSRPNSNPGSTIRSAVQTVSPAGQKAFGLPAIPTGNAGSLTINTPSLNISQEGVVTVENQGTGSAGTLTINADNLNLDQAGNITAAAESGLGGNIELKTQSLNITNDSQITASAGGNQDGGNITINTTNLTAKKNNQITASAFKGDGGNVDINAADSVSLNDRDSLSATSEAGEGGNITLNTDQLQIKNNSLISTSAGGLGNGGNIEINAGTILAINDSDITATAVRGNGGNITITADGILGIEERKATPGNGTSDIDASSEFGEDGTVTISDPQVLIQDPIVASREIDISEPDEKIESKCGNEDRSYPKLVYTGRSGFSAEPDEYNDDEQYFPAPDYVTSPEEETEDWDFPIWKEGDPLIEANAIRVDSNGEIYFVAELSPQSAESLLCTAREEERTQD